MSVFKTASDTSGNEIALLLVCAQIAVAIVIAYNLIFVRADPPPPASIISGCFYAKNAPVLMFRNGTLSIDQTNIPHLKYYFVLQKYGTLSISTKPSIFLQLISGNKYVFSIGESGLIYDMVPAHVERNKIYPVFKIANMEFLNVSTKSGQNIAFRRVDCMSRIPS